MPYPRHVGGAGDGVTRALRAALATLAVVGLSALAHQLGGGAVPGPVALGVLGVLVGPAAWVATGRRIHRGVLLALVAGVQALAHLALASMAPTVGTGVAHHVHGALPSGFAPTTGDAMAGMTASVVPGPTMLLMHLAATVLLTLLLSHVGGLVEALVRRLAPAIGPQLPDPGRSLVRATRPLDRPARLPARPLGGRAPPVALV